MSESRKAYGWEKVGRTLLDAGSFWITADEITKRCGVKQPARRVHDLKKKGVAIDSKFIDRQKGIYAYRLAPGAAESLRRLLGETPPEPTPDPPVQTLFDDVPAPSTAHYLQEAA